MLPSNYFSTNRSALFLNNNKQVALFLYIIRGFDDVNIFLNSFPTRY